MFRSLFIGLVWLYWKANRPFTIAFSETLLGYGDGDFRVDGKKIYSETDTYLKNVPEAVLLQFVGTLAVLPLYTPPPARLSALGQALSKFWFGVKSFFSHGHFLALDKEKRTEMVNTMFRNLIADAPDQTDDSLKTIVTFSVFKWVLSMAYMDDPKIWKAMGYLPFQSRPWNPPSGPNLVDPPRTPDAELLHKSQKSVKQVSTKPAGQLTYCVLGSGAGGAIAARTIQEQNPKARVLLLEAAPLITGEQYKRTVMGATAQLYMNAGVTLSKDMQFLFQQGRSVGGSTTVYNSVAFKPTGFWWEDMKARWTALGVRLDYDDLYKQFDVLDNMLSVSPVDPRVIIEGAYTTVRGWEDMRKAGHLNPGNNTIHVASNSVDCPGCGRCNYGCQYASKQSTAVAVIPDFVRAGGILVPNAKVNRLDLVDVSGSGTRFKVNGVWVAGKGGQETLVEADRFVLATGAYATSKLLWRSGFLGVVPGYRTVGKRFAVNAGSPVNGVFPEPQNSFLGQQIGFALEVPEERMVIETGFAPPGVVGMSTPQWGADFQTLVRKINHVATAVPVFATLAYGQVKRGLSGDSGFVIDFSLIDEDWRRLEKGMKICGEAMFRQGADEIFINRFDGRTCKNIGDMDEYFAAIGAADFITVQSAHMQGGNVMAHSPARGVVDENMKIYGMENAWICDASVIPSPITINIALTVMALSRYAALRIAQAA